MIKWCEPQVYTVFLGDSHPFCKKLFLSLLLKEVKAIPNRYILYKMNKAARFSFVLFCSLTPCGVSGLKLRQTAGQRQLSESHPTWGEWIEICRGARPSGAGLSHPTWGEWIEILLNSLVWRIIIVSPHVG